MIDIDQSPIGRTPRSNPATYTGAFTNIRDWFAGLPESQARGYKPGRFSFNVKGGRCEACAGDGLIKIEMHFLPDVYVTCDVCHGQRYNRETLEVKFKGHSIADVLDMTVEAAAELFKAVPPIRDKMRMLEEVGLGYIKVGQQATTLSGGEAQRVKLAKELSRRATGQTLYILDEPTTGLHFEDVRKLLEVLHALVEQGNTVVVIEHNLEVIKTADWIARPWPRGRRQRRRDRRRRHAGGCGEGAALLYRRLSRAVALQIRSCRARRCASLRSETAAPARASRVGGSESLGVCYESAWPSPCLPDADVSDVGGSRHMTQNLSARWCRARGIFRTAKAPFAAILMGKNYRTTFTTPADALLGMSHSKNVISRDFFKTKLK